MPAWSNNDNANSKPKFVVERTTREVAYLTTANVTLNGNNTITFTYFDGTGSSNLSNVISVNTFVYGANASTNGVAGFFATNNRIQSISGNNVTFTNPVFGNIASGTVLEFDKPIAYNTNKVVETTYWADTILVTDSRIANSNASYGVSGNPGNLASGIYSANVGSLNSGWVHIQKKTNADGTVRYLKETLVALANSVAANVNSGNTSFGGFFKGI